MIINAVVNVIYTAWAFFISIIPEGHLPSGFTETMHSIYGYAYAFDFILPIDTLLHVAATVIAFQIALLFMRMFFFGAKLARG